MPKVDKATDGVEVKTPTQCTKTIIYFTHSQTHEQF